MRLSCLPSCLGFDNKKVAVDAIPVVADQAEPLIPREARKVLHGLAAAWADVEDCRALEVVQLKGAMTNEVYQIQWSSSVGDNARKVLVRVYGEGVDVFFNREDEIRTFECMSKHGQGPRLLGRFPNGRVEEFIHARTLSAVDLRDPEISALVAAKLREFHDLDMPGVKTVALWDRLRNWLKTARRMCPSEEAKEFCLDTMEEEITFLETQLSGDQIIGFCHNDLQYGNIMMDEETRLVTIIVLIMMDREGKWPMPQNYAATCLNLFSAAMFADSEVGCGEEWDDYEYASFNPVAYDIANHFCEMAADYHTETPHILNFHKYPEFEERKRFVQNYLSSLGEKPDNLEVDKLLENIEKYALASHLVWGLWGIISEHVNEIDFDYMEYARQRFQQYWSRKNLALSQTG